MNHKNYVNAYQKSIQNIEKILEDKINYLRTIDRKTKKGEKLAKRIEIECKNLASCIENSKNYINSLICDLEAAVKNATVNIAKKIKMEQDNKMYQEIIQDTVPVYRDLIEFKRIEKEEEERKEMMQEQFISQEEAMIKQIAKKANLDYSQERINNLIQLINNE